MHRPENYTNRFLLVQGTPEKYWSLALPLDCCKIRYPPPPSIETSTRNKGHRSKIAFMSTQYRTHAKWWGIAGDATTRESTFTACFSPQFALFPRWDRTGWLKQWELDKGRERKTILWSANRKFQTPPPPIFTDHYSGFDPYSGFEPPPPPCWGLTLIPGWPLFRVLLYVAASVTGSTGSAAYTWPTLTKIKTQQEYIRISYVLLLIKKPARAIRPHNGNSSTQVPTLSIFPALFYPYACNGPPSGLETVLTETCWLSFSTTFLRHFDGMDKESYAYLRVYQFFSK